MKRREFMKGIMTGAGSGLMLASAPWLKVFSGKAAAPSALERVRLGIIGVGDRGSALLQNIQAFALPLNVEIAAICDNYEPNYQRALELTAGKAAGYRDYRRLLERTDLDGVVVATPLHVHAPVTLDALQAGQQVFCEKSMARTLDDSKAMYDLHRRTGRILQVGHQRLFSPIYLDAMKKIRSGELGQITHIRGYWHRNSDWRRPVPAGRPDLERKINWRLYTEYSAGLFTELMSHQLQVASWIKGMQPVSVVANGGLIYWKGKREVYDHVAALFTYPDDAQFIYDSINSNKHYGVEEQIFGSRGTLELEVNKIYAETPPAPPAIRQLVHDLEEDLFATIPIGGASWVPETAVRSEGGYITGNYRMDETRLQLEAFVGYIRAGQAPEELTRQAYYATVWSLLAEEAARTGARLKLEERYHV